MNKFLQKLAKIFLGLSMVAGVGVAIGAGRKDAGSVYAGLDNTPVYSSGTPSFGSSYAGNVTKTMNSVSWTFSNVGNNTSMGWNKSSQNHNNPSAPLTTMSQTTKIGGVQTSGGWKVGKIVVTVSNIDSVTGTWYVWYSTNSGSSWTLGTSASMTSGTTSFTYDHGSNIGNSVRFAFGYGTTKTTGTRVNLSNIQVYQYVADTYTVTKNGTNCTISGASTVNGSQAENFTITPSTNYDAPETITVKAGTTTLTQNTHYSYYTSDYVGYLTLNVNGQTGNITITAVAVAQLTVTDSVTHGSLSSTARIHSGDDLDVTIVPDSGYTYPTSVNVTMGGNDVTEDIVYENGEILYGPVTGNIVVTATCAATGNTYSISTTVTNGTYSGDTTITDNGGVASVTIAPTGDYKLPASVSVSGADHTYNASTGVISLSNATGNVTISAAMVALTEYSITVNKTNGSYTGASTIKESRTASLTFEPDTGYGQPSSVTVTGATYTWTRGTGVLSLSNPTGNVTVTYVAVGNELDSIEISTNSGSYTLGDNFDMPTVTAKYTVNADADVTSSASYSGYDPYTTGSQSVTISYTEGGITKTKSYTATVNAASVQTVITWELTDLADLTSSDEFVIARTSGTTVALPNNGGASTPTVSAVTISNNKITSTVTDSLKWNVSGNASDGYIFYPNGSTASWLYLLADNNSGVRIGDGSASHFTLNQGYLYTTETTYPRMIGVYNNADWRCYKLTTDGEPGANIANQTFGFFKKVETQIGSADLIRITATYKGGEKYVGDSISTSDFTVKKQLNTGNELIDVASGYSISAHTLTAESNSITISYTEGNITKTAVVVVPATPRAVTLVSVELVQGENVVKEYVDWSGVEWNFTDLSVRRTWSDASTESLNLADLVESEDASVSPVKPAVGVTSFTVSYEYLSVSITNATVSDISVVADYVDSVSWTDKSLAHFKSFSGGQLTAATVSGWTVKATYAGAGETSALSFGTGANQFTIRIGDSKSVTSLPYTWVSADDGELVYVVVGGVAQGDSTHAKANICASINAIDHDEESTGEQTITLNLVGASYTKEGTSGTGSETEVTINGFTISSDKGYAASESMRVYDGGTFTITSSYQMTNVSLTTTGGKNGLSGGSASGTTYEETADGQARVTTVTITYNGTVTTTTHYANQMEHFDAQKKVVEFAKYMNTTMNGTNVCSGTFGNLESAWDDVADKYDELFGASTTLNETELAWAKKMFEYATAAWGSDAEAACVEKAMKTYEFCVAKYDLDPFMSGVRSVRYSQVSPLINIVGEKANSVAIIVIISMVSVTAIGGYFFLRKRKENN